MTLTELQNKIKEYIHQGLTFAEISRETGYGRKQSAKFYEDPEYRPPLAFLYRLENLIRRIESGEVSVKKGIKNNPIETYPTYLQEKAKIYHHLTGFASEIGANIPGIPKYVSEDKLIADILFAEKEIKQRLLAITKRERWFFKVRFNDNSKLIQWIYLAIKIRRDYAEKKGLPYQELWSGERIWRETYGKWHEINGERLKALQEKAPKDRRIESANRRADLLKLL